MVELVAELIVSLDGYALGTRSPGYFGYYGPEFGAWIEANTAMPHRVLMGRKTYEALNALPDDARDEGFRTMMARPGYLFSRTLERCDWPGLELVRGDMVAHVAALKRQDGPELRTLGSLSLVRQLLNAGLVDRLKLMVCPLILPESGAEPLFEGLRDTGFDLAASEVLDGRVLILDYRPAGAPPGVA
jgi:dihydrofolate reductase